MNYLSTQSSLETVQNHNLMFGIQIKLQLLKPASPVNFDLKIDQRCSDNTVQQNSSDLSSETKRGLPYVPSI